MPSPSPLLHSSADEFLGAVRAATGNQYAIGVRVPVVRSLAADLLTPVAAYLSIRGLASHSFLFESVEGGERLARYSFVGGRPSALIRSVGLRTELEYCTGPDAGRVEVIDGDPREVLRTIVARAPLVDAPGLPRFLGGAVGFFAYDSMRLVEDIPRRLADPLNTPDLCLALHDEVLAFDHRNALLHLVRIVEVGDDRSDDALLELYEQAAAQLEELELRLETAGDGSVRSSAKRIAGARTAAPPALQSSIDQDAFEDAVARCQEHILAGDIFQVVLSRRLSCTLRSDPFAVYRALRILNPSPYLFFLEMGEHTLVGASPEMLVRVEGRTVETMPIAGTRPRGETPDEDEALADELQTDPKELAEHEMLVDLGRNDIGRVASFGTVRVAQHRDVQRFSHVMHLVSRVVGELAPEHDALDALYSCFPAGTVSGAPKVRAMQIIEDEEPIARGVYAGAVGYLDYRGDLDTCIAIRTAVAFGGEAHVQAGAGIVVDSVPQREYEETINKARALIEAIRWAESGALDLASSSEQDAHEPARRHGPTTEEPSC